MPFSQTVSAYLQQQFPGSHVALHDPGGNRAQGTVIADAFHGLPEEARLSLVWNSLRTHFGPQATKIGVLLLFTPSEASALANAN